MSARAGLTQFYDRLTVWERIPLLIAADARKDEAEYGRLFATSPVRTWRFSEHLMAEMALHTLALTYIGEQLDAAANYFFALWRLEDPADPRPDDWLLAAESAAYFFTANAEAWRQFCDGLGIAPGELTAANRGGLFLAYCKERMPENAPTAEALSARFARNGRDVTQLVTAEELLASWQELFGPMTAYTSRGTRGRGK
jgi:hypothetical protein